MNTVTIKKGTKFSSNNRIYTLTANTQAFIQPRKKQPLSDYEIEANETLKNMGITMSTVLLYNGPHFEGEKENRDVYQITFSRLDKSFTLKFGQSIMNSVGGDLRRNKNNRLVCSPSKKPTAYDILACIEKYEVEPIFEDWAPDYGYSPDSIKASKIHQECLKQYRDASRFFTSKELEQLQEIN